MAKYTSVLHQLLRHVPRDEFRAIVERHQGDKGVRKLSCWGQFVALFFGQLTGQHSLRDLVTTLDAGRKKLQQVGLGAVSRSTLADANRKRPQEIFGELFACLYSRCRSQAVSDLRKTRFLGRVPPECAGPSLISGWVPESTSSV